MLEIIRRWHELHAAPESNEDNPIRQVYIWLLTTDDHLIIVSKDGNNWQLPGGKPEHGENTVETTIRETREETGIDITRYQKEISFFGEYTIDDGSTRYRQVRSWVRLPQRAQDLNLTAAAESSAQFRGDMIVFVNAVHVKDIVKFIPWLSQADEFTYLVRSDIIKP